MSFDRSRLPDPALFFEAQGLKLSGKGKWRTTRCELHGGSDSMRVNVESGGWVCMNCGVSGGDSVSYLMQTTGATFAQAAQALGAWTEDGKPAPKHARSFSAADAVEVLSEALHLCVLVISDARHGVLPTDADWHAFLEAAGQCITVSEAAR